MTEKVNDKDRSKKEREEISYRFRKLLSLLGMSMKEFADELGVSNRTIQAYVLKENTPNFMVLKKIADKFNVNLNWLVSGEGEVFKNDRKESVKTENSLLPQVFLDRIKEDLENAPFGKLMNLSFRDKLQDVINGKAVLTRKEIIELAQVLGKNVDEYLTLSSTLPPIFQKMMEDESVREFLRSNEDFTPEDIDNIIKSFAVYLEGYKQKKKKRNEV